MTDETETTDLIFHINKFSYDTEEEVEKYCKDNNIDINENPGLMIFLGILETTLDGAPFYVHIDSYTVDKEDNPDGVGGSLYISDIKFWCSIDKENPVKVDQQFYDSTEAMVGNYLETTVVPMIIKQVEEMVNCVREQGIPDAEAV